MEHCYQLPKLNKTKVSIIDYDVKWQLVILWHLCSWFLFLACYEKGEDSLSMALVKSWDTLFGRIFYGVDASSLKH
jgi:hypothetical protein